MSRDPRLPAMMRLWQDSFGDSDAFVRLFFTRVYRPRNALTLTSSPTAFVWAIAHSPPPTSAASAPDARCAAAD